MKKFVLALSFTLLSFNCSADFKSDLLAKFPVTKDAKIERAFGDFYSVIRGNEVIFVNSDLSILINGEVIDLKQNRSLTTSLRDANRPKLNVSELDLKDAIKFGSGPEKIYIFSDPDCPFCKRLEGELEKLPELTIYVFPFPIASLHPNAAAISESIWCNKSPATAWRDYVVRGNKPVQAKCKNPIEKNIAYAQKANIFGTPAIIFEDGKIIPGSVSAAAIRAQLITYQKK